MFLLCWLSLGVLGFLLLRSVEDLDKTLLEAGSPFKDYPELFKFCLETHKVVCFVLLMAGSAVSSLVVLCITLNVLARKNGEHF